MVNRVNTNVVTIIVVANMVASGHKLGVVGHPLGANLKDQLCEVINWLITFNGRSLPKSIENLDIDGFSHVRSII